MSQVTNVNPDSQPTVVAKVRGDQVQIALKDDLVWHAVYEKLLKMTVIFMPFESAASDADKRLFERAAKQYLSNKGMNVLSTEYHENASKLKEYLTVK